VPELRLPAGEGLIDWQAAVAALRGAGAQLWAERLPAALERVFGAARHGELDRWLAAVAALPVLPTRRVDLRVPAVTVGDAADADEAQRDRIRAALQALHPWRKGPFDLFGVSVDAEWRSDLKWARVAPHLDAITGRRVLDVGCGNGYYGWRLCGEGAVLVIGIDPNQCHFAQYLAVRRLLGGAPGELPPFELLPLRLEDLPAGSGSFDTVLSMGVVSHRRDPLAHFASLQGLLRSGGQVVVEGLVVEGDTPAVFVPDGRYAQMRNVWAIPTPVQLLNWLGDAGFSGARIVDRGATTSAEQRRTPWMRFASLADFLDPDDPTRTVEGHPAPVRAVAVAWR